jgi:hypothetical protein
MVVVEIGRQRSLEMTSVQDNVMVETLPSNRADESLGVWVLPGTLRCSQNLLHTQGFDSQSDLSAVPAVSIAEEISGGIAIRKRLYDLLGSPVTGRMLGHIKVQQLAAIAYCAEIRMCCSNKSDPLVVRQTDIVSTAMQ